MEMAWLRPENLDQALNWLSQYRPVIVCGGTDLFVNWQRRQREYEGTVWMDIQKLPELKRIARTEQGLEIGAGVTAAEIWQNETLNEIPALQQAARIVGGWQIQNRASLGGNIANASPAADMVVPLFAYGAHVQLAGPNGMRSVPIRDFIVGPRKTALEPGELITSVIIPKEVLGTPQVFLRHDQRGATDISLVSAAVVLKGTPAFIEWGATAVGAANPAPLTLSDVDAQWNGPLTEENVRRISEAYAERCKPITDVRASAEYRKAMVGVYIRKAVNRLFDLKAAARSQG